MQPASAQSKKDSSLIEDCHEAKADFIHTDALLKNLFEHAAGYVIFPNVGKGAVGVGGAAGNGIVFVKDKVIGRAKDDAGKRGLSIWRTGIPRIDIF
jgi:hypothetical protein